MEAVSIPVMAKARIDHFVEAQLLEALGIDYIDESGVLAPADENYHIDKHNFKVPFVCGARNLGEDLRRIENELRNDKDTKLVSMVFHETSTRMINPINEVGELAQCYGKMYHVNAISAVGGEDVNVERDNIDFCTGVPNKSLSGQPGVSFICVNRERINEIENIQGRN